MAAGRAQPPRSSLLCALGDGLAHLVSHLKRDSRDGKSRPPRRVVGTPPVGGFAGAMDEIDSQWMGDDSCAESPAACEALVAALGVDNDEGVE